MSIIPKVRNIIREIKTKEQKNVLKCHVNSLARMESACVLREGLIAIKLAVTFPQNFEKMVMQSLFCCCHAVFQGVSRWMNNGVHLCVGVSVW